MIGLFLKMEQNNLYNEINFNLTTLMPANSTAIRRTIDGFVCPSNRRPTTTNAGTGTEHPVWTVRLSGQHGGRNGVRRLKQQLPDSRSDQCLLLRLRQRRDCTRTRRSTWPISPTARPRPSSWVRASRPRASGRRPRLLRPHERRSHHQQAHHFPGRQLTGRTGRASTPAWSTSPSATAASGR